VTAAADGRLPGRMLTPMQSNDQLRRVTLADVAARARVDRSVVSRVINGDPGLSIRDTTRKRVAKAIEELGYRPNSLARSLRTARAGALGLLIPDFSNPIYAQVIKGAEAKAAENDCLLVASSASGPQSSPDAIDLLTNGRVDGMLFAGHRADGRKWGRLDELRLPWLLLNQRVPGASRFVILDDERAARIAVEHLLELGHRRIGHLAGHAAVDTATRRRKGYVKALAAAGIDEDAELIVETQQTNAGGSEGMARLLALPHPPTAIFVSNIAAAIGSLYCARHSGVRVPDDVSVVAVHDVPEAAFLDPPLTTVRMPLEELGRRGVELLLSEHSAGPVREVLDGPMELVVRESTTAAKTG
jgi:LacI family transcriptional regulator